MQGYIHSIETSGMVDGPGIRYVIFTQGCLLRCQFCHNPDTWEQKKGKLMSVDELIEDIETYLPYMKHSNGGVTVSGGEPLLQIDFVIALFKKCKELGIHTTVDTSAGCFSNSKRFLESLDELLKYTDLFLLDIKQINNEKHKELTSLPNTHILQFAKLLSDRNVPVWIRHVLVPTKTDDVQDLKELGEFIQTLTNVEKIEILPYHQMGVYKWEQLGIPYALKDVNPPNEELVKKAKELLGSI
ncbi:MULTISPECIES: pyruvate formate-lyase-activating protein [Sutcliffiella]|uniref:pyruvate formate-lyase-activating protein n=1 Tax=Sutcliffiella TaxID=2837511 RepID=UPI0022DE438C|nr:MULTISPECIES: pyruvate formate-lyase-activating protein [Sutcliffiella]MED4017192.1 pyruvate formate-lyase-activating protein [Sutcliffiella cohnii]WBL13577.1 pyruvate formate-lyase-activating protein [Sutcliffiella sp. NC1]